MKSTNDETTQLLSRLETGFRTDCARLEELEQELTVTLERARHFGIKHGSPDAWNAAWQQDWDNIAGILRRIRALVKDMDWFIQTNDRKQLDAALEVWTRIQSEDAALVTVMEAIRTRATGLDAAVRKDWNSVAHSLEPHLTRLHACAQALRIRVELLRKQPGEDVDQTMRQLLAELPRLTWAESPDGEIGVEEQRQAITETEQAKHETGGLRDIFKGLLMWIETPMERMRSNRSLKIEEDVLPSPLILTGP